MKAKKLFPDLSFKRLWDKIKELENKVSDGSDINLDELNKKLEWIFHNRVTGSTEISLPADFKELLVVVIANGTNAFTQIIPKDILSDTRYWYNAGNNSAFSELHIKTSTIKMNSATLGGNAVVANSILEVYYK